MPDVIRDDMAFIDRLHFYLPGWEIPKMRNELFTDHYGFVVDYLAEALRELRKHNFTEIIDHHFSLGAHLNARDRKAVRKTVSGLMKILYPHGEVTEEELAEILELALEGRRRVKEQLKKMGSFEYYQTSFSYTDKETGEERFVGVPEQGGRDLISADPLAPGTVYTAAVTGDGTVGLYRVEVSVATGTGKLKLAGGVAGAMKESIHRAFSYLQAHKVELGVARELRHVGLPRRGHRPARQPGRGRDRRRLLRGRLLGAAQGPGRAGAARPRRHEHPGQHQAAALADRAAAGRHGQRRQARPDPDREQAQLPRRPRRRRRARGPDLLRRPEDGRDEGAGADVDDDGDDRVTPAEMPPLPAAAREAGIDSLHLGRKAVESLGARGATTIGDLIDGGYLSRVGWDALGRDGGKAAWAVVCELGSFCHGEDVDWLGFWASRGVAIVPGVVTGEPDLAALVRAVPALLRAALADVAAAGADPDRGWVIIDGRNGLVSQPKTLEELGAGVLGLTRERIRQIDVKAMRQLREAWALRFRGTSYRVSGALDPALAQLADDCAAVEGPVTESELLAMLGLPATLSARDLRLAKFLLELAGLRRFDADGGRRQAMWAPQSHASAGPRINLSDRIGRLLTEELTGPVSAADITATLNRGAKGDRVTLRDVEGALPLSPLVERLDDGRWQGQFEYLTRRTDQVYRILDAAGGPVELREVARDQRQEPRQAGQCAQPIEPAR